jgi:hypothetical protein
MANDFRVHDLIADNVYSISGIYTNITANNLIYNTGNQFIEGNKTISDILYDIAKEIGAVRLTYTSNRKWWLKTCKKMKCKPTVQIYEREVVQ